MRIEGYLVDKETGVGFKVLVVDLKPNSRFPSGGYALKVASTQRLLFAYIGRGQAPEAEVLSGIKQAALKHGYLFCSESDDFYDELVATATPVQNDTNIM